MYGCESWTVKKAEHRRIDAFEVWCWRRLLRVRWTARRSNQSILKEISPGCSLEGMILKLKLQYFGHLMWRVDSLEKTLMLGGIGGRRRRGQQRMRWLDGTTDPMDVSLSELWELVMDREALACCGSWSPRELYMIEQLNWTELKGIVNFKVVWYLIFYWLYIFVFIPIYPLLLLMECLWHCILWVAIKLFIEWFKNSHTLSDNLHSTLVLILIIF